MKSVILCGGYATRLYPLTIDKPKSLLPVRGRPILDYIIEKIPKNIEEIIIVSNNTFYKNFLEWGENHSKKIKVINDGTTSNETRLGGIGGLEFVINKEKIKEDVLVFLGDNLFDFSLENFVNYFKDMNNTCVGVVKIDSNEIKKMGVIEIKNNKIISFEEKPEKPKSNLASIGIYCFTKNDLEKIKEYMRTEKSKEGPGFLIKDFVENGDDVFAYEFVGRWFDIGNRETYDSVNRIW